MDAAARIKSTVGTFFSFEKGREHLIRRKRLGTSSSMTSINPALPETGKLQDTSSIIR